MDKQEKVMVESKANAEEIKPLYEVPTITAYTEAELLEQLGPARAGGNYSDMFGGV